MREENLRLFASGMSGGTVAVLLSRLVNRRAVSVVAVAAATLLAVLLSSRTDAVERVDAYVVLAGLVVAASAIGAANVVRVSGPQSLFVLAAAAVSCAGVFAGVPETGPAVIAGGVIGGLALAAGVTRLTLTPTGGGALAMLVGWAALSGAAGRPWAAIGGALCTGIAPWLAVVRRRRLSRAGAWMLAVHAGLVIAASRWIAVSGQGWARVAVVGAAGAVGAVAIRGRG
jgi:hypothetical protein